MSVRRVVATVLARWVPCGPPAGCAGPQDMTNKPVPPLRAGGQATEESQ
ncbi:hypothetical protein AB0F13_13970 [Streptomyces sp. NPDC026206]